MRLRWSSAEKIGRPWSPWDGITKTAPTSSLLEAFQIGIFPAFLLAIITMASPWGGSLREGKKRKTSSHIGRTRCRPSLVRSHITRCFLPDCPVPRFACYTPHLSPPHHTLALIPTVASLPYYRQPLLLAGCRCRCFRRARPPPMHGMPVFKTATHPPCMHSLYPIWKIWLQLRLVSRKPHGGYWIPRVPPSLQLHSRSLPRCTCSITFQHAPPSPTHLIQTRLDLGRGRCGRRYK